MESDGAGWRQKLFVGACVNYVHLDLVAVRYKGHLERGCLGWKWERFVNRTRYPLEYIDSSVVKNFVHSLYLIGQDTEGSSLSRVLMTTDDNCKNFIVNSSTSLENWDLNFSQQTVADVPDTPSAFRCLPHTLWTPGTLLAARVSGRSAAPGIWNEEAHGSSAVVPNLFWVAEHLSH